MILFVTLYPSSVESRRRLRQFQNLKLDVRHFHFVPQAGAQTFNRTAPTRAGARLKLLLGGILRLRRDMANLSPADIVYVNALDCLGAALLAGLGRRPKLACQILDVHPLLLEAGPWRWILTRLQLWMLARIQLLVVPNRGNITRYYGPAGYKGAYAVVHNTLPSGEAEDAPPPPLFTGCWIIGWFGSLRCQHSLEILCRVAQRLGPRVEIRIAGGSKLPGLAQAISPYANIKYLGPYDAAADAARLYRDVHLAFALHFEFAEKSKWVLPVRILEGGAYGRPALARGDVDAGAFLQRHAIGWAIDPPFDESLAQFLARLSPEDYAAKAAQVREQRALFVGEDQLAAALAKLT